ncbi:MAG: hypothetical protein JWQ70_897 [Aeromicrobium sp.]|nr:hypothetical protein [Aeromicrobium sp.]
MTGVGPVNEIDALGRRWVLRRRVLAMVFVLLAVYHAARQDWIGAVVFACFAAAGLWWVRLAQSFGVGREQDEPDSD